MRRPDLTAPLRAPMRVEVFWGGLALAHDGTRAGAEWLYDNYRKAGIIAAVVLFVSALFPPVAVALAVLVWSLGMLVQASPFLGVVLFATAGGILGWEQPGSPTSYAARRVWSVTAVGTLLLVAAPLLGVLPLILCSALALVAVLWVTSKRAPAAPAEPTAVLDTHEALVAWLRRAKVKLPDGAVIGMPGHPLRDDYGKSRRIALPLGMSWTVLTPEALTAGGGFAADQVKVFPPAGDQGVNTCTLWVGSGHPREVGQLEVWEADDTDALEPQLVGHDALGQPRYVQMRATHTLWSGKTRSGKTVGAREVQVVPALIDSRADVVLIDGKGARGIPTVEWRPMTERGLCRAFVAGTTTADLDATERVLDDMIDESERRMASDDPKVWPLLLILVDEWLKVRNSARGLNRQQADRLDAKMATLGSTIAGANMHLVFCVQRGTVGYLPGDLKANIGQRLQGVAAKRSEIGLVIDCDVPVEPRRAGEFLHSDDEGGTATLIRVPYRGDAAFADLCERIARRDAGDPLPAAPVDLDKGADRLPSWQECVAELLADGGHMTSTELHNALAAEVRPDRHPNHFGRRLTADASSDRPTVAAKRRDGSPAWVLSPLAASVGGQRGEGTLSAQTASGPVPSEVAA